MASWPNQFHENAVKYLAYSEIQDDLSEEWSSTYSTHELPRYQSRFYSLLMLGIPGLQAGRKDQ